MWVEQHGVQDLVPQRLQSIESLSLWPQAVSEGVSDAQMPRRLTVCLKEVGDFPTVTDAGNSKKTSPHFGISDHQEQRLVFVFSAHAGRPVASGCIGAIFERITRIPGEEEGPGGTLVPYC